MNSFIVKRDRITWHCQSSTFTWVQVLKGNVDSAMTANDLPYVILKRCGPISAAFIQRGLTTFGAAARYVQCLPYSRNSDGEKYLLVLSENRGTCSTKHALVAALAREQQVKIDLLCVIFAMTANNFPLIKEVLHKYKLLSLPEAHCYLRYHDRVFDLTFPKGHPAAATKIEPISERLICPEDIGAYKTRFHRRFLVKWLRERGSQLTLEHAWEIREECIARLATTR
jgi:hypothetical protein